MQRALKIFIKIGLSHFIFDLLVIFMVMSFSMFVTANASVDDFQSSFSYLRQDKYSNIYFFSDLHFVSYDYLTEENDENSKQRFSSIELDTTYSDFIKQNNVSYNQIYYANNPNQTSSIDDYNTPLNEVINSETAKNYTIPTKHGTYFQYKNDIECLIMPPEVSSREKNQGLYPKIGSSIELKLYEAPDQITGEIKTHKIGDAKIVGYLGQHDIWSSDGSSSGNLFCINNEEIWNSLHDVVINPENVFVESTYNSYLEKYENYSLNVRQYYLANFENKDIETKFLEIYGNTEKKYMDISGKYYYAPTEPNMQKHYYEYYESNSFNVVGYLTYLQYLLIGCTFIVVVGRIAFNRDKNRKLVAIYMLSGASRRDILNSIAFKNIIDAIFAFGFSFLLIYLLDYGYIYLVNVYANIKKCFFGLLVVILIYSITTLIDYLSLRNANISTDLKKDD